MIARDPIFLFPKDSLGGMRETLLLHEKNDDPGCLPGSGGLQRKAKRKGIGDEFSET